MSEKIKIETVNKISQIYSVDVHCNPLIVDVRLDVEKNVSATSEPMSDEESAKANAYAKAKGEFKVDVIVDPSFIIKTTYSNPLFALIASITFGFLKFGVRYIITITGYAGYYTNARSYYEQQKSELLDLSEALEDAFSNSPKLTADERKLIERLKIENHSKSLMSPSEQEVLKKYNKILNKSSQAFVFKSIFYPNIDTQEYDYSKTSQAKTSVTNGKFTIPRRKAGTILKLIKPIFLIGALIFGFTFAFNKIISVYDVWKMENELERMALENYSSAISRRMISIENGFSGFYRGSVDSLVIANFKWNYKVEDYEDSVDKYDIIRLNFLKKYTNEYMPKIIAKEVANAALIAAKIEADSLAVVAQALEENANIIGEWNGTIGNSYQILIMIQNINDDGSVSGYHEYNGNRRFLTGFKNGPEFELTDDYWVFRFSISNNVLNGFVTASNKTYELTLFK